MRGVDVGLGDLHLHSRCVVCKVLGLEISCYIPGSFGIVDEVTDACMEYAQCYSASQVATIACRKPSG